MLSWTYTRTIILISHQTKAMTTIREEDNDNLIISAVHLVGDGDSSRQALYDLSCSGGVVISIAEHIEKKELQEDESRSADNLSSIDATGKGLLIPS